MDDVNWNAPVTREDLLRLLMCFMLTDSLLNNGILFAFLKGLLSL